MIDYHTFCQIKSMAQQQQLTPAQIAAALNLDGKTVKKWLTIDRFEPRHRTPRSSCLDPHKATITRLLDRHPYSAVQIWRMLREQGYTGGYTMVKEHVRRVRPRHKPAYLTLSFAPGQCAQADWGQAGVVHLASTSRRLYFFVMVLAYSRMLYVEFSFRQSMEHFLAAQRHAFEFFGGVPQTIMVDNCKTAILSHPRGEPAVLHPHYADFARHYSFTIKACNVRAPNEKGQVEKAVDYIKQNLLNGLDLSRIAAVQAEATAWRDQIANQRLHRQTGKRPIELFAGERKQLQPLPPTPYDCGISRPINSNSQFRVRFDGNSYSVPAPYASTKDSTLRAYPDQILLYHQGTLIATHPRSYERGQDYEHPDHPKPLLQQRRKAADQILLRQFFALGPEADTYYRGLAERRFNPMIHVRQIMALSQRYGLDQVKTVLQDAVHYQAFSADYIANLLEQRQRIAGPSSPLHLTRNQDLLDLQLDPPNLDIYPNPTTENQP